MGWFDLLNRLREKLDQLGPWTSHTRQAKSEIPPVYHSKRPPRYNPAPPPPSYPYKEDPPPHQFDYALYERIVQLARRLRDPSITQEAIYEAVQQSLQNAYLLRTQSLPSNIASALDDAILAHTQWLSDYQARRARDAAGQQEDEEDEWPEEHAITELPVADIQNWPRQYREQATPEAEVHKTPGSSHVYSYVWVSDEHTVLEDGGININPYGKSTSTTGTLIVTFKEWVPGMKQKDRPNTPGPTYAYASVTRHKYEAFASSDSAGEAVWDYLRVRGTVSGHQHAYRLISVTGEYIPRMATPFGFQRRNEEMLVVTPEDQRIEDDDTPWFKATLQSTLPSGPLTRFGVPIGRESHGRKSGLSWGRISTPNRGTPNRGTPNRGR